VQGIQAAASFLGEYQFSVSDNGSLVYIPGTTASGTLQGLFGRILALVDRNGSPKRLDVPQLNYDAPRISPDGKQVAVYAADLKGEVIVWIYALDGKTSMRRLTFGGKNIFPIWSSDGQRILFSSDREGDYGLFWQRADGNGVAERVTKLEGGWTLLRADAWSS